MDYELNDLRWIRTGPEREAAGVQLRDGDSAPDPASTSRRIYGPVRVDYVRTPEGISAYEIPVGYAAG